MLIKKTAYISSKCFEEHTPHRKENIFVDQKRRGYQMCP
jgi:hypothetical protein